MLRCPWMFSSQVLKNHSKTAKLGGDLLFPQQIRITKARRRPACRADLSSMATPRTHGGVRGNNLSRSSLLFEGPFGRIFRSLPPADFGANDGESQENLVKLAEAFHGSPDDVKDTPDGEEGGIPAAYTYLGQFIDHDLTFDPASSLQKQNDPDALVDFRTPRFDLDNLYGRGPEDQPYMFQQGGRLFTLGKPLDGATPVDSADPSKGFAEVFDLQRNNESPARALIGDARNDENMIIAQLQGLWHRFHNAIAVARPAWDFPRVQQEVRFCYQWILVHDFLPRVIDAGVLENILPGSTAGKPDVRAMNLTYYRPRGDAFMPLEFSAAAYRFGHSMVRIGYRMNDTQKFHIFERESRGLRGFDAIPVDFAIDWRRFIDITPLFDGSDSDNPTDVEIEEGKLRLQAAYKMDTSLVDPLSSLPKEVSDVPKEGSTVPNPLAELNLRRGWRMRLPSGQSIARAMGLEPLDDSLILFGKKTGDPADELVNVLSVANGVFAGNLPLWAYVLAETIPCSTKVKVLKSGAKVGSTSKDDLTTVDRVTFRLGPVGGTIVGETFLGILRADSSSYVTLDPKWTPKGILGSDSAFGLREMIMIGLGLTKVATLPAAPSAPTSPPLNVLNVSPCVGPFEGCC